MSPKASLIDDLQKEINIAGSLGSLPGKTITISYQNRPESHQAQNKHVAVSTAVLPVQNLPGSQINVIS